GGGRGGGAAGRGGGGGGRGGPGPAGTASRAVGGPRGPEAATAALDQVHRPVGQPGGRRPAVVGAGAEQVRGELGLEVGGVGAGRGVHLHAGLDQRAQLVRQAVEVRALA